MPIRRVRDVPPPLGAWCVHLALQGWLAPLPAGVATVDQLAAGDRDDAFSLWLSGAPAVVQLWRDYEAYLRREAHRLGVAPAHGDDGDLFFGEYLARRVARPTGSDDAGDVGDDTVWG
jgi:hypothetical protein